MVVTCLISTAVSNPDHKEVPITTYKNVTMPSTGTIMKRMCHTKYTPMMVPVIKYEIKEFTVLVKTKMSVPRVNPVTKSVKVRKLVEKTFQTTHYECAKFHKTTYKTQMFPEIVNKMHNLPNTSCKNVNTFETEGYGEPKTVKKEVANTVWKTKEVPEVIWVPKQVPFPTATIEKLPNITTVTQMVAEEETINYSYKEITWEDEEIETITKIKESVPTVSQEYVMIPEEQCQDEPVPTEVYETRMVPKIEYVKDFCRKPSYPGQKATTKKPSLPETNYQQQPSYQPTQQETYYSGGGGGIDLRQNSGRSLNFDSPDVQQFAQQPQQQFEQQQFQQPQQQQFQQPQEQQFQQPQQQQQFTTDNTQQQFFDSNQQFASAQSQPQIFNQAPELFDQQFGTAQQLQDSQQSSNFQATPSPQFFDNSGQQFANDLTPQQQFLQLSDQAQSRQSRQSSWQPLSKKK